MKIKSLRLENFQGIQHAEFDFDGLSASIYGDNATGKTTVFNAVTWLLFDKASTGAKNFTPKTKGAGGDLHNLDHSAEASFILDSGEIATFKKVYHEVWKKKRGSSTEEFDGHTIDFYIDGVPTKEKAYTSTLQNYCGGIERMKMLTMPDYFAESMPWDERRKILIEICGDITDADVIQSNEDLADIDIYLRKPVTGHQFYSVEEYKKIAAARKSEINKQLLTLPGRIDEARRAIPEQTANIDRRQYRPAHRGAGTPDLRTVRTSFRQHRNRGGPEENGRGRICTGKRQKRLQYQGERGQCPDYGRDRKAHYGAGGSPDAGLRREIQSAGTAEQCRAHVRTAPGDAPRICGGSVPDMG